MASSRLLLCAVASVLCCTYTLADDWDDNNGDDDGGGGGGKGGHEGTKSCEYKAKDGTTFNLSPMTKQESDFTDTTAGGFTYQFNVCSATVKVCNKQPAPASKWRGGKCNNLGDIETQTISEIDPENPSRGIAIRYNEGDICKKQQGGQTLIDSRQVTYEIYCNPNYSPGHLKEIKEVNMCEYTIVFQSVYGCPSAKPGMSIQKWFLILLCSFTVLYCGGGYGLMRYKYQASGMEAIPQLEFWRSLPGLVKDGVMFFTANVKELVEKLRAKYGK